MTYDRGLADRPSGNLPQTTQRAKTTWMKGIAELAALVFLGCWFTIIGFAILPIIGVPELSNAVAFLLIQVSVVAVIVFLVFAGLDKIAAELRK